jgi:hypothetical protein
MPYCARIEQARALLAVNQDLAAAELLCRTIPQSADDVLYLVRVAYDVAPDVLCIKQHVDLIAFRLETGNEGAARDELPGAIGTARDVQGGTLCEALLFAGLLYWKPELEEMAPVIQWYEIAPESEEILYALGA